MYESGYTDGGMFAGTFIWVFFAAFYLFFAYAQYRIAKKCGKDDKAWWGFVPILNLFLMIECSGRPWYWLLFLLVPIVNIVVAIMLWVDIAKAVDKSPAWGVLMIVPFINLVALGVLAFSAPTKSFGPPRTPSRREPVGV